MVNMWHLVAVRELQKNWAYPDCSRVSGGPVTDFPKFNGKIAENLRRASQACYVNGNDLLDEANILYERERYARATSLAILAEEEFSKSMILQLSSINGRWDKVLYDGLVKHELKQALSGALSGFMDAFTRHLSMGKFSISKSSFDFEKQVKEEYGKAEKVYINKKERDKRKQDAQFVAIGRTGLPSSTPKSFARKDADVEIDHVVRFKAYIDASNRNTDDDNPLFRGATTIDISGSITTLNHKSGITIRMKPFAWVDTGYEPDNVIMNPHVILPELGTFDPKKLDDEQKTNLARIYKAYDFTGQIRTEMQKLGLRGTDFLDEVEGLIKKWGCPI